MRGVDDGGASLFERDNTVQDVAAALRINPNRRLVHEHDGGTVQQRHADVQAALRRDLETDSRENGFVLNQLSYAYQYDEPIPDPAALRAIYDQLTPALLREAARTYLDTNRYVKVLLFPEK